MRGLIANRNIKGTSKNVPKTQVPHSLPPRPLPPVDLGLQADHDPKKKRPLPELEEGEVPPQRGTKQQKVQDPKDKRGKSIDSRDNDEVYRQQCI